jgi:predicted GNAT superfamily acetyltransferase
MKTHKPLKISIRELQGVGEMVAAESLQKSVWESSTDFDHKDILLAIQHSGGLVAGAFTQDESLVGFILAFSTMESHGLHSHRLAVLPEFRHHHLGERMKWFQRDWGLERGIEWIQWTYDPLLVNNANLNIHRLGAIAAKYYENYYGTMDGINSGTPSDRVMAVWYLNSPRVLACLNDPIKENGNTQAIDVNRVRENSPDGEFLDLDKSRLRINLPSDFNRLMLDNLNLALEWRFHIRRLLQNYFSRMYYISGFTLKDGPAYFLQKYSGSNILSSL